MLGFFCMRYEWAPVGNLAHANPMRDLTGLAHAQGNPAVPTVALTNPVQDC